MQAYFLITPQIISVAINKNKSAPKVRPTITPTETSSSDFRLGVRTDGVAEIVGDTTELIDGMVVNVVKDITIFSTVKRKIQSYNFKCMHLAYAS